MADDWRLLLDHSLGRVYAAAAVAASGGGGVKGSGTSGLRACVTGVRVQGETTCARRGQYRTELVRGYPVRQLSYKKFGRC